MSDDNRGLLHAGAMVISAALIAGALIGSALLALPRYETSKPYSDAIMRLDRRTGESIVCVDWRCTAILPAGRFKPDFSAWASDPVVPESNASPAPAP